MKLFTISLLISIVCSAIVHPSFVTPGWKKVQTGVHDNTPLSLTVALKQRNLGVLESKFWDISNPQSKNYRKYMNFDDIKDLIAPNAEDVATVQDYFTSHGASPRLHGSGDFLKVRLNAAQAREMFGTTYDVYLHESSGKRMLRSRERYTLHPTIDEHIDFISGERLPNLKSKFNMTSRFPKTTVQKRQSTYPGPQTIYVNPLDKSLMVTFIPVCSDGTTTTSLNFCSDRGTPIKQYTITVTIGEEYQGAAAPRSSFNVNVNVTSCRSVSDASALPFAVSAWYAQQGLPTSTVFCVVPIFGVPNYEPLSINVASTYNNADAMAFAQVELGQYVTPQRIWDLYGVPQGLYATNGGTTQAVAEFLGQYYSPADLSLFFGLNGLADFSENVQVIGPNNITNPGGEASLDIQYIMGVAQNVSTTFWSLGNLHEGQEPFLDWIVNVLNNPNPPLVHSISYGDDEPSLDVSWMQRVNVEFQKAGLQGISLLFSSGDTGVYGQNTACTSYVPSFPATSPYVTAVGATLLTTRTTSMCFETTAAPSFLPIQCSTVGEMASSVTFGSRVTSGGGFSNVFARPPYQMGNLVENYVNNIGNLSRPFNTNGRIYPDVAALGHNFLVLIGGEVVPVDGTSASAPTFAAIISLLNDHVLNRGDAPLGFLNPLLYSMAGNATAAFNDITVGDNSCSEQAWNCCPNGFSAAVGFDAVTGLGSPNFKQMRAYIENAYPADARVADEGILSKAWQFFAL